MVVTRECPHCGELVTMEIQKDELGEYLVCEHCSQSFDTDVDE